jgi:hypothetical protein
MTEKERVAEHLNMLSIMYYVYAGLLALGSCGGLLYAAMGGFVAAAIRAQPNAPKGSEAIGGIFIVIGGALFLALVTGAVCCFLSARFMKQRRNRSFSQIVAAIGCLNMPLGTVLGVFALIALGKPEAMELYAEAEGGGPPPPAA